MRVPQSFPQRFQTIVWQVTGGIAVSLVMPRPLRFIPENCLVGVTSRTIHGRFLLRPSKRLTEIILGTLGRAQRLTGMRICAFVYLSNHCHLLLRPTDAQQLSDFMRYVNSKIAREAGRLHDWREKLWGRPLRA